MNYADIIAALPADVATLFESKLDSMHISSNLSQVEAQDLFDEAVKLTKLEMVLKDEAMKRMVDTLLTMLSGAGVKAIFG